MKLDELKVTNLRNITSLAVTLHPAINFISGVNGSGKTSFLEAIYLLSSGHSFRTREISHLINHGQDFLTIYAKTTDLQKISIQKALNSPTIARINGVPCQSSSELAAFLPCQVFYQDIFQLIDAGPAIRRNLLDWGMFHVEHNYFSVWKNYKRVLKQRNALLKQKARQSLLIPWDKQMSSLAADLDSMRRKYIVELNTQFEEILQQLTSLKCGLEYQRGWGKKDDLKSLEEILFENYDKDMQRQYTQHGPHHADLLVSSKEFKAKHYLSRGQQKIILFALKFAQTKLINKPCVYLIDDMTSELDQEHVKRLTNYISTTEGQFFITLRPDDIHITGLIDGDIKEIVLSEGCAQPNTN
ncbi:DNA replication/repair protein RecF [Legionella dresdenensis]|uniref:DNA replication and repair protein RecF n=1 Tax=Legionella dresdenensis TaxID=450200 RepID=A0ABV8CDW6_9GAMM